MANYSFVVGSNFQPLSYQELLAPVQASTEAHLKKQDELGMYEATAEALRERAIAEQDQEWAKKYMDYVNTLEDASNSLATQGLSPLVREKALRARKGYFSSVVPAQTALARLQQLTDYQFKQNPELRMAYGALPTIDTLIAQPEYTPAAYSGKEVYEQALKSGASVASKNIIDTFAKSKAFPAFIQHIESVGYKEKDIEKFTKGHPEIKHLIDTVANQHQNFEGLDEAGKDKMKTEIVKGLFDGALYSSKKSLVQDPAYMEQLKAALEKKKKEEEKKAPERPTMDFSTRIIKTGNLNFDKTLSDQVERKTKEYTVNVKPYLDVVDRIGNTVLNSASKAEADNVLHNLVNIGSIATFRDKYVGETEQEYKAAFDKAQEVASSNRMALRSIMNKVDPKWVARNMPAGGVSTISLKDFSEAIGKIKDYQSKVIAGTEGQNVHDVYAFSEFSFPLTNEETQKALGDMFAGHILYKAKYQGKKGETGKWVRDESDDGVITIGYQNKGFFGHNKDDYSDYANMKVKSIDFSPSAGLVATIQYGKSSDEKLAKVIMPDIDVNVTRNIRDNIMPRFKEIYDAYKKLNANTSNPDDMRQLLYRYTGRSELLNMNKNDLNVVAAAYYRELIDETRAEMAGFITGNSIKKNEVHSQTR